MSDMHVKMSSLSSNYISCIRINNVPILPPLITSEKSKELRKIKTQAIKIEKRINREKELRLLINEYSDLIATSTEQTQQNEPKKSTEHQKNEKSKPRLSCDIQSSQYINNQCFVFDPLQTSFRLELDRARLIEEDVSVINEPIYSPQHSQTLEEPQLENNKENIDCSQTNCDLNGTKTICTYVFNEEEIVRKISKKMEEVINQEQVKTPPRLLRSNSYTLESPSPALIQHLNQNDSPWKKANSVSTLNDTFEIISENKIDFDTSGTESELNKISDIESLTSNEKKLKQFIDNNVPNTQADLFPDLTYISEPVQKHCQLQEILKNIPEIYSKKIFEMLEKKKGGDATNPDPMVISAEFDEGLSKHEKASTPVDDKNNYTLYYQDNGESFGENEEPNLNRTWNCDEEREKRIKIEEKAATIITAAAKGFIVRRLLKTSKIRDLIETIKDALVCAMQLHTENVENIDRSDVELHRRLIQQVSAGCYAFYDVFFNTSVEERMAIIAADRQKKKEKLLRPLSNLSISSNRSTPRSRRSMNSSFT